MSYLINIFLSINLGIFFCYLFARCLYSLSSLRFKLEYIQQLKFLRHIFLFTLIIFLLMPFSLQLFPTPDYDFATQSHFIHQASLAIVKTKNIITSGILHEEKNFNLPILNIIFLLYGFGIIYYFYNYFRNLNHLKKLSRNAVWQRTINNVHILFTQQKMTAYCFSLLHHHFIVLSEVSLQHNDLRFIINHELQHIRHGDTYWLHFLAILKNIFYINPFMNLWTSWFNELQEYACDEAIILRNQSFAQAYAECLFNTAKNSAKTHDFPPTVLAIRGFSSHTLLRRINMIFTYNHKKSKYFFSILYVFSFLFITTSSLAMQKIVSLNPITGSELTMILKQNQLDSQFKITPTHEVVAEINQIRSSKKARLQLRESLNRMQKYSPAIIQQLKEEKLPNDLLAMPLIQSGYRPLDENKNPVKAAGIWQIVPTTAKNLGLNINHENDERLNTTLSTKAALTYLKNLYNQFHDWKLAVCAYEYGEDTIEQLINVVGSRDAWTIARSIHAPKTLKHYLAKFDSAVIIMHNPSLQT